MGTRISTKRPLRSRFTTILTKGESRDQGTTVPAECSLLDIPHQGPRHAESSQPAMARLRGERAVLQSLTVPSTTVVETHQSVENEVEHELETAFGLSGQMLVDVRDSVRVGIR